MIKLEYIKEGLNCWDSDPTICIVREGCEGRRWQHHTWSHKPLKRVHQGESC